jgi:hypothetical protein
MRALILGKDRDEARQGSRLTRALELLNVKKGRSFSRGVQPKKRSMIPYCVRKYFVDREG